MSSSSSTTNGPHTPEGRLSNPEEFVVAVPNLETFVAGLGDAAQRVTDWKPWHPHPDDSPHRNISLKSLQACAALADKIPSQSPEAKCVDRGNYVEVTVGDKVYQRPKGETIIDFLIQHLMDIFGKEWGKEQYALTADDRHAVMRWYMSFCELQKQSAGADHQKGQLFEVQPSGDAMEFISLADDIYRLRLVDALQPKMINRLRHQQEFQGARYECAIAASFVRAGFTIAWQTGSATKCEFVATQKLTGEKIAVEVKSRRRPGTLNEPGELPELSSVRLDVKHLYEKALSQCPTDMPCAIFIDVNLPRESIGDVGAIPWWNEVKGLLDDYPQPTADAPGLETCLVLTSYNWHYTGKQRAQASPNDYLFPEFVRHRLTNPNTFIAILRAIHTYGQIPSPGNHPDMILCP